MHVGRHESGDAHHDGTDGGGADIADCDHSVPPEIQPQHRLSCYALVVQKSADRCCCRQHEAPEHRGAELVGLGQGQHERARAHHEERRAAIVDGVLVRHQVLAEVERQQRDRGDAHGQIDPEDDRPRQVLHDESAKRGPDYRRDAPDAAEVALHASAVGGRVEVGDDGCGDRNDGAGAQALQRAKSDERNHVPGKPAERRAHQEQGGARAEHALAAVEVREPAIDRDGDRLREQIDREYPAEELEAAELCDDRRHRARDDGALHRRHEHSQHDAHEHQWPPPGCASGLGDGLIGQASNSKMIRPSARPGLS